MATSDASGTESTSQASTESSTGSTTESTTESETDDPAPTCTTEWDCGLGERCLDGNCLCMGGCACDSPNIEPGTIDAPDEDEVPAFFDVSEPECWDNTDCDALEFCSGIGCVPTSQCVEDLDCREDWWPTDDRFCIDGLCQPLGCDYALEGDANCPPDSLCEIGRGCMWLAEVPSCAQSPAFEQVMAHVFNAPDTSQFVILDVDLDGRDDIVVLDGGFISWLLSTGVGFGPPMPWAVEPGVDFSGIAAADVHGDGVDELLVLVASSNGVELLAAGPSWPEWIGFAEAPGKPDDVAVLDVDYDGLPDLVMQTNDVPPMTVVTALLGDGTGTFEEMWTESLEPFELSQPAPFWDDAPCRRAVGSIEPTYLGARRMHYMGIELGSSRVVGREVVGHVFFPETLHPAGFLATAALVDRGVLFFEGPWRLEIEPAPGAVALVHRDVGLAHAIVDHGADPGEFVEFEGNTFLPSCRGNLEISLDAEVLDVGDFDGDGREDLLSRGADGVLRAWFSRD